MNHRPTPTASSLAARFAPATVAVSLLALMACSSGTNAANQDGAPDSATANQDGPPTPDGAPDAALSCPLTCDATQYCRFIFFGGSDGGCGDPSNGGGWSCVDLPASCNGTAACACLCGACCRQAGNGGFACPGA
jgi:hypothetical protein